MLTNVPDHELTLSPNKKSSKRIGGPAAPPYGERRSRYSPNGEKSATCGVGATPAWRWQGGRWKQAA
jgi:hypothetical protein